MGMEKYYFGIDIGGSFIKFGLFDSQGSLLEKWEIQTRLEENGALILPDLVNGVKGKINERRLNTRAVGGIGIGVPGQVDECGNVVLAENLGWRDVPLVQHVKEKTGLPVKAENDANLAALGEYSMGSGKGCRSMMLVTLGTGVGCGIIVDGKILTGAHQAAGEIGHIHVDDRIQEPCSCGKYGCLEQLSSARGIVGIARRILQEDADAQQAAGRNDAALSAKRIFEAAGKGEALGLQVTEEFGLYLGKALAMCACVVDPEVIVLGGGVSKAGSVLLEPIQKYYRQYAFLPCENTEFRLAKLGNDAGICGAARLFLGHTCVLM